MIRDYQPADFDQLIDVWFKASKLAHPFLSREFLDKEILNIRDIYIPNTETFVFEYEGRVIGFTAIAGNEIGAIFLDPAFHGRQFGKALMDHAVNLKRHLELDVFKENHVGQKFYFRYGFKIMHEHVHEETGNVLIRLSYDVG